MVTIDGDTKTVVSYKVQDGKVKRVGVHCPRFLLTSFSGPAHLSVACGTKSWAGPGNEVRFLLCGSFM